MSDCHRYEEQMEDFLAGDPVRLEGTPLGEHVRQCAACARVVALHGEWSSAAGEIDMPTDFEFHRLRERVRGRVDGAKRAARSGGIAERHWRWAAMLLLGIGLGAVSGRLIAPAPNPDEGVIRHLTRGPADDLLGEDAAVLSNVTIRPAEGGRVEVGFDVTRHIGRVEDLDSPLVKRLVVQALRTPGTLGARLKAVDFAERVVDPAVLEAMIGTLHQDENLAVRMKVLGVLARMGSDPRIREAVLRTLEEDESVQMRLLAIDYLSEESVDPDEMRRAIEASPSFGDPALMLRLSRFEERGPEMGDPR